MRGSLLRPNLNSANRGLAQLRQVEQVLLERAQELPFYLSNGRNEPRRVRTLTALNTIRSIIRTQQEVIALAKGTKKFKLEGY